MCIYLYKAYLFKVRFYFYSRTYDQICEFYMSVTTFYKMNVENSLTRDFIYAVLRKTNKNVQKLVYMVHAKFNKFNFL